MKNYVTGNSNPEAYITKGKQRVKQFNGIVYLNDGDNFEIEIFNPTSEHISADILVNGKLISSRSLVLRPGERVFLERYLDTNNKFVYSTYEVNGGNEQVKKAIASNGIVNVKFHKEEIQYSQNWGTTYVCPAPTWTIWPPVTTPTVYYSTGLSGTTLTGNITGSSGYGGSTLTSSSFNCQSDNPVLGYKTSVVADSFVDMNSFKSEEPRKIETGTVEKGESSKQSFETVNRNFQYYSFHNVEWHIMPKSRQPITSKDLKNFCTECGAKIAKSTYKFCPNCGERINS